VKKEDTHTYTHTANGTHTHTETQAGPAVVLNNDKKNKIKEFDISGTFPFICLACGKQSIRFICAYLFCYCYRLVALFPSVCARN